jgi:hypothetical protein
MANAPKKAEAPVATPAAPEPSPEDDDEEEEGAAPVDLGAFATSIAASVSGAISDSLRHQPAPVVNVHMPARGALKLERDDQGRPTRAVPEDA